MRLDDTGIILAVLEDEVWSNRNRSETQKGKKRLKEEKKVEDGVEGENGVNKFILELGCSISNFCAVLTA